jgi:dTDP-L-rhamnose 4-epimerase
MARNVLITGGAGFIGSHIGARLLARGDSVRALDCLHPQVHGDWDRPPYLSPETELVVGDVRDRQAVERALDGIDTVVHLAARVGVGQSMYEAAEYSSVNAYGTAVLLQALPGSSVSRLVVASSMSVYGEGCYVDGQGVRRDTVDRSREQVEAGRWDPVDADGEPLTPRPTPESKTPVTKSAYALDKLYQERLCLIFGETYGVPTTALRLFNAYGPNQALSNPYTGVLAIFAARLLNGRPPLVFEDGLQRRDFVHVDDVARAFLLAMDTDAAAARVINIGSGRSVTIDEVARMLARVVGRPELEPQLAGKHRVGDIRHCFADVTVAGEVLGYRPQVAMEDGVAALATWLEGRTATDRVEEMAADLASRGLAV